jgi:hypothetical protein
VDDRARRDAGVHPAHGSGDIPAPTLRRGYGAKVSRIALVPFVIFYSAWETLQGIGNGALVDQVNELAASERAVGAALVQDFAESPFVKDMGLPALYRGS